MASVPTGVAGLAAGLCAIAALADAAASVPRSGQVSAPALRSSNSATFCAADEAVIFSCPLGTKRVSVCGSGKQATYRYGAPGNVELTIRNLHIAERGLSGGGETQISASNNGYSYVVYDKTVRTSFNANGQNAPDSESGLLVRHNGRTLSSKRCGNDAPISSRANAYIPAVGQFFAH